MRGRLINLLTVPGTQDAGPENPAPLQSSVVSGALVTSDTIPGSAAVLHSSNEEDCSCGVDAGGVRKPGVCTA